MATCGSCGHDAPHGRRGYGSCSHRELTPAGREAVARFEGMTPAVRRRLVECVVALPGMTISCTCVGGRMLSPGIPAHDVERAARAAAGLCRNCGRPAVEYVVDARGFPPTQCWVGKTEYSCAKPLFDDVEDRRPPAP